MDMDLGAGLRQHVYFWLYSNFQSYARIVACRFLLKASLLPRMCPIRIGLANRIWQAFPGTAMMARAQAASRLHSPDEYR
jgi:hypothetical protein